jgi:putative transposase
MLLVPEAVSGKKSGAGAIGVDMGISIVLTLSDGARLRYPGCMSKSAQTVRTLQLKLSHKKRGSQNYQKARLVLDKSWRKVRRQRNDLRKKSRIGLHEVMGLLFSKIWMYGRW